LADAPEESLPPVPVRVAELEIQALENRPELREEDYRARIDGFEARRQLIALLPGIEFVAGNLYDSNKYLYNNSWYDSSVRISWNVLKLAAYPTVKRTQEAREQTAEARRLALSMAVITQVRVALERYKLALLDYRQSDESARVDERLAQISQAGVSSRVASELEAVRTESRALVTQFQRYAAYANAQTALGRILNSVGQSVLPDELETRDLATVAKRVAAESRCGRARRLPVRQRCSTEVAELACRDRIPAEESLEGGHRGGGQRAFAAEPLADQQGKRWRCFPHEAAARPGQERRRTQRMADEPV
jgi:hypothetical protein